MKYWASLRFDDPTWLDPSKVFLCGDGLYMTLERTKVSGPGERVGSMIAVVSTAAYFREER